jgi:hypothetical protein
MVANAVANSCIPYWFPWFEAESMIIESDILFRFGIERNEIKFSFNSLMTGF